MNGEALAAGTLTEPAASALPLTDHQKVPRAKETAMPFARFALFAVAFGEWVRVKLPGVKHFALGEGYDEVCEAIPGFQILFDDRFNDPFFSVVETAACRVDHQFLRETI